ncbi:MULTISPECIES: hypothetical protein [unclassified Streptomyces]|uniref:hypothetical protein n=1 Tax=unclassified Streptomyces TaxID=2593676 RepID=UPI002E28079D|nr:hypothetical protein [Streptomyces sp. NBC_00223]
MADDIHLAPRIVGAPDAAYQPPQDGDPIPLDAMRTHLARCAQCRETGAVCVVGAATARVTATAITTARRAQG